MMASVSLSLQSKYSDSQIKSKLDKAVKNAAYAVGVSATNHAKETCPVDTGRLRNSLTHKEIDGGKAVDIYVGTNVEYGKFQEARKHYLKKAAIDHTEEYQAIIKAALDSL